MRTLASLLVCACLSSPGWAQQQPQPSPPAMGSPFALKEIVKTLPKSDQPLEVRVEAATLQPGVVGGWHTHPTPTIVYIIEGTLSVEFKEKGLQHHKAGEAFVEPIDTVMRATNQGQTPVKFVVFQVSPPDVPDARPAQ